MNCAIRLIACFMQLQCAHIYKAKFHNMSVLRTYVDKKFTQNLKIHRKQRRYLPIAKVLLHRSSNGYFFIVYLRDELNYRI